MHLLFIDESGAPPPPNKAGVKNFCLGGIIIPQARWHSMRDDLNSLKKAYGVNGEIKWRYFSPNNDDENNSLQHLDPAKRESFKLAVMSIITKYKATTLLGVVANIEAAYKLSYVNNQMDLYWFAYKQIAERFQYFLQDISRKLGVDEYGMIVCDHRNKWEDNILRELHSRMLDGGPSFTSCKNLIEGLFMAPSHLSVGIQFADLIAGGLSRHFNSKDDRYTSILKPSFRNSPDGKIEGYGLVYFPKK
ncbi:MAG: DUF3800 domain-containing protein [Blastochloris viridis]|uniref:DUF3800 domain-containing protein n=1 Tax=Blastochloris viridis TaxID=1079 RepID=A0A6N4R5V6_BLAVI|nr:MAG: DUF3800 domain-containing protein [Blastochloris viridis]